MIDLILNGKPTSTAMDPGEVTLDFIRHEQGIKGTKEGCREGDCGACSVLLGKLTKTGMHYRAVASCLLPVGELHGKHLVTIEGLNGKTLSSIQQAIIDEGATQCGFCTPGIVIALTGFLLNSPTLSKEDAIAAVEGNICRCTGYTAISRAIERLTANLDAPLENIDDRIKKMVTAGTLPDLFLGITEKLTQISPSPCSVGRPRPKQRASASAKHTEADAPIIIGGGTDIYVQKADKMLNTPIRFISRAPDTPAVVTDKK